MIIVVVAAIIVVVVLVYRCLFWGIVVAILLYNIADGAVRIIIVGV